MTILMIVALPASGQSKSKGYSGEVSFTKPEVSRKDGRLNAKFIIDLSNLNLKKQTQFTLTPMLVSADGNKMIAFEPYVVAKHTRYTMIRRKASNDKNFELPKNMVLKKRTRNLQIPVEVEVPFKEWMRSANMRVDEKITGCAMCEKGQMLYTLNNRMLPEIYQPNYVVAFITPEVEPVKVRSDKFVARINFRVAKWDLLPNYMQNGDELKKVDDVVKTILNDKDITVNDVTIDGYASPEGKYRFNVLLAKNRAKTFVDYMKKKYNIEAKLSQVADHAEDWDGLVKMVSESDMKGKQEVLDIIKNTSIEEGRETKIMKLMGGEPYRYMAKNFFPTLRRTEYTFTYTVKGFDLEEAKRVYASNPKKLSLNELYLVANSYPMNSMERHNVLKTAARLFPNDPVSKLNLAASYLDRSICDEAEQLLQDLPETPDVYNNKGVYYAKIGQYQKAIDCFKKSGTAMAKENLSELMKRIETE